ncbi:MAG: hypothetical protein JJ975_04410 [Bacteroidia bacterium]|nr:hypothetical protein [Bacteroidia bacterium]
MTKLDFFRLTLKILGLYAVFQMVSINLHYWTTFFVLYDGEGVQNFNQILLTVVPLVLVVWLFYLVVIRPDALIKLFHLDRGFDDDRIDVSSITASDIMKFGIILVGGYFFITNVSDFVAQIYYGLEQQIGGTSIEMYQRFRLESLVLTGLNAAIGFLLVTNCNNIANRLLKIQTTNDNSG